MLAGVFFPRDLLEGSPGSNNRGLKFKQAGGLVTFPSQGIEPLFLGRIPSPARPLPALRPLGARNLAGFLDSLP